jgi:EKC/KEOPS complex subunit PCC1/LAGE3
LTNAAPTTSLDTVQETQPTSDDEAATVLRTVYRATTNRMLRVSVNGFFESLNVVLQVVQELDLDVLQEQGLEDLQGAQGVEQGMIGTTKTGA